MGGNSTVPMSDGNGSEQQTTQSQPKRVSNFSSGPTKQTSNQTQAYPNAYNQYLTNPNVQSNPNPSNQSIYVPTSHSSQYNNSSNSNNYSNNYQQNLSYPTVQAQPSNYNSGYSSSRDNRDNKDYSSSRDKGDGDYRDNRTGNEIKDYAFRYSRNGKTRPYIINEDEMFFREHLEQMKKKQCKIKNLF